MVEQEKEINMKKQKIQLIIIGIILIFVVAAYTIIKNSGSSQEEETKTVNINVTNVTEGDVTELEYIYQGKTMDFVKQKDTWYYKGDKNIPIVQSDITNMVSYACSISTNTVIEQPEELKNYGLENPTNTVSLTLQDGSVVQIMIGDYLSITGDYYAMVTGDSSIYTIASYYATCFEKSIDELTEQEETISEVKE